MQGNTVFICKFAIQYLTNKLKWVEKVLKNIRILPWGWWRNG